MAKSLSAREDRNRQLLRNMESPVSLYDMDNALPHCQQIPPPHGQNLQTHQHPHGASASLEDYPLEPQPYLHRESQTSADDQPPGLSRLEFQLNGLLARLHFTPKDCSLACVLFPQARGRGEITSRGLLDAGAMERDVGVTCGHLSSSSGKGPELRQGPMNGLGSGRKLRRITRHL